MQPRRPHDGATRLISSRRSHPLDRACARKVRAARVRRGGRMSSERLRQANRANAARSTGPRSRAGRAKAARNARRYGLSLPIIADAALAPEVAALARAIVGEGAGEARRAAAARIAEAQIDLTRIRHVQLAVSDGLLGGAQGH